MRSKQWRGERDTQTITSDGSVVVGTWRATGNKYACKAIAVKPDGTPTGTRTCTNCQRITIFPSFKKALNEDTVVGTLDKITSKPNALMNAEELRTKLALRTKQLKNTKRARRRRFHVVKQARAQSAKDALECGDVKRFIRDIQCLSKRGTLKEKQIMW